MFLCNPEVALSLIKAADYGPTTIIIPTIHTLCFKDKYGPHDDVSDVPFPSKYFKHHVYVTDVLTSLYNVTNC